jgi:hypothetical protein
VSLYSEPTKLSETLSAPGKPTGLSETLPSVNVK